MYPYNSRYESVLQYNQATNEPFIPLPAPHSNIRLTPPRMEDTDAILPIMNDLSVCMNFGSPPYPYLREDSEKWLGTLVAEYEEAMQHIEKLEGEVGFVETFPLRHIREVGPDGTETFIGDIGLSRENVFHEIKDVEARAAMANTNANIPPGDPDIVWVIGGE
jgi:hypothetical protein